MTAVNIEQYILVAVIFAAVVSVVIVLSKILRDAARASEERINLENAMGLRSDDFRSPEERFVDRGRLFTLRIVSAVIPALLFPAVLLVAGIRNPIAPIAFALVFGFCGWMLPQLYVQMRVKRRQAAFELDILDLTLGVDNALRAGMALPQALERISERMGPVMKEELGVVQREYRLGIDFVQALERLHRRMPCEDMRLLVSAIRLTTEAGGSLADVLKEMSEMIRARREFQDKLKTLTAEGRFEAVAMSLAPVAAFLFMYFIQPELMRPLYTTVYGWCALGAVAALEIGGYFVISKIVSIEV